MSNQHKPISPEVRDAANHIARTIDLHLNGEVRGKNPKYVFCLLITEHAKLTDKSCSYISNGERDGIVAMMKEMIARFEGRMVEPTQTKGAM